MISPCWGCQYRTIHPNCHGECREYLDFLDAVKAERYLAGQVSAELAIRERRQIDAAYDAAVRDDRLVRWCVQLRKGIEIALGDYQRDQTTEKADRLVGIINGFIRTEGEQS